MKKSVFGIHVFFILISFLVRGIAQPLNDVYRESRSTLSIVSYDVEWSRVITDEILIEAKFDLKNETQETYIIRRVGLVVGTETDLSDVARSDPFARVRFLETKEIADPDYPEYKKEFWAELQTDTSLPSTIIAPGQSVTARFACILERKKDVENVAVMILDYCEKKQE